MNIEDTQKEKKEEHIGNGKQNSIYVGDLPTCTSESDLFQIFSKIGEIYTIVIPRKEQMIAKNKCYAYVTFLDESSVPLAIEAFNFYSLNGAQIRVMPLNKEIVSRNKEGNIVIKNLPKETENHTLHDTFAMFGEIDSAKVERNCQGECSGVGYIQYRDPKVAEIAINMINKITLQGKKLSAVQCIPNERREKKKEDIEKIFTNIYVKNFPKNETEEGLKKVLGEYGELVSFLAPKTPKGDLKGFAFANYLTHEMAEKAIAALHDKPYPAEEEASGINFYVQRAKPKTERVEELTEQFAHSTQDKEHRRNVYITNLPGSLDEDELIKHFSQFGRIVTHKAGTDVKNNRSYAYVCYETPEEAACAVEKGKKIEFAGQVPEVAFFKSKKARELEKVAIGMYNNAYGGSEKTKKKAPGKQQDNASASGYELYTLILSLAPNYTEKIACAGFSNEEEFAKKITGMILELGPEEVKKAAVLGNVLSNYVEESLEEIIVHRKKSETEEEAGAIE